MSPPPEDSAFSSAKSFLGDKDNGPLSALFSNKYRAKFLQYPLNLDAAEESHWIRFDIQEITGAKIKETEIRTTSLGLAGTNNSFIDRITASATEKVDAGVTALKNAPLNIAKTVAGEVLNGLPPVLGGIGKSLLGGGKSRAIGKGSIMLFSPHARQDGLRMTWGAEEVGQTGAAVSGALKNGINMDNETVKSVINNLGSLGKDFVANVGGAAISNQNLKKLVQKSDGHATNPHLEMFFTRAEFRTFAFDFKMAPRNTPEAKAIHEIVALFKYAAAPQLEDGGGGLYYKYPNVFDISFKNQDQTHKIAQCALTSVTVNHSGSGVNSTFYNGYPTETDINLTFSELEIMHKDKIDMGY